MAIATKQSLEDRLLTLVSRFVLALIIFLLTTLWTKVDNMEAAAQKRDKDLAAYMIDIEHRLTTLETLELELRE